MFEQQEDESVLWRDLKYFGYDSDLRLTHGTRYVLSTHSTQDVQVLTTAFDNEAYTAALRLPVLSEGEIVPLHAEVSLLVHSTETSVSFAVENKTDAEANGQTLVFTIIVSTNGITTANEGTEKIQQEELKKMVIVPPGQKTFIVTVVKGCEKTFSWAYKASWQWQ
jgi:hypothetical protein